MPKHLSYFKPGEAPSINHLNQIVEEIKRLQNIRGARDILVTHQATGVLITRQPHIMTIDDKYRREKPYNQSDRVRRLGDLIRGEL